MRCASSPPDDPTIVRPPKVAYQPPGSRRRGDAITDEGELTGVT
jgi:hypothetical protein